MSFTTYARFDSLSVWQPARLRLARPATANTPTTKADVFVQGRHLTDARANKIFVNNTPSEHLFFGGAMETNRATIEAHRTERSARDWAASLSGAQCARMVFLFASATACSIAACICVGLPPHPKEHAASAMVVGMLVLAMQRAQAEKEAQDMAQSVRQLYDIYQAHEALGHDPARASWLLRVLRHDRDAGLLTEAARCALLELAQFINADKRPEVQYLSHCL